MEQGRASTTAMGTALMRAAHTRLDSPVLIDDPWGDLFVLDAEREAMLARAGTDDLDAVLRAHPSYGTVILRAHYAESALSDAVARGIRQYVIIGAGMDSFALRRPEFAHELEVFEVDHPDTQQLKAQRLAQREIATPDGLHLVAADLSETPLDVALAGSEFRSDQPTFFSWLGVTTYLTRDANLATLAAIASCAPEGSELVFSYAEQSMLASDSELMQRARDHVASVGEPWVSGFEPSQLDADIRRAGLWLLEDLGPEELNARYCSERHDGLLPSHGSHVAHARVLARASTQ
jgi:methyltransferase (TIGR00027 family)